jgi:type IV pilus assembly protein PilA
VKNTVHRSFLIAPEKAEHTENQHMRRYLNNRNDGFTIVEMLVVLALLGVIASIVFPIIGNNQKQADRAVAISDGRVWSITLANMLVPYIDYGTGTATYSDGMLYASLNNPAPSSPSELSEVVSHSVGTALTSGVISGRTWCLAVSYKDQIAVYTPEGFNSDATGCATDGTAQ